jgi:hypothetical protein
MASTTLLASRIESSLHAIQAEVDFLPELVDLWDTMPESAQVSQSLDWDHLMGSYLTELDRAYRSDAMSAYQRERYRALLDRLREVRPLLDRLNFWQPPVSLEG